jgi:hypothetical protein
MPPRISGARKLKLQIGAGANYTLKSAASGAEQPEHLRAFQLTNSNICGLLICNLLRLDFSMGRYPQHASAFSAEPGICQVAGLAIQAELPICSWNLHSGH